MCSLINVRIHCIRSEERRMKPASHRTELPPSHISFIQATGQPDLIRTASCLLRSGIDSTASPSAPTAVSRTPSSMVTTTSPIKHHNAFAENMLLGADVTNAKTKECLNKVEQGQLKKDGENTETGSERKGEKTMARHFHGQP
ncbi:unnamed protein product [Protopolystoma xenopodis]|uniref:Uncharacterized protein n=1 Tax=Protopolystoma xenopodis TaxID=117903 RepID=A0A448WM83_9PLAT|nr:unnamed protein product [Protopolystoma xenopodis]